MAVRSRRFFGPTVVTATGETTLYDVPDGRTARFSALLVTNGGVGTQGLNLRLSIAGATTAILWEQPVLVDQSVDILDQLVLNPDDRLVILNTITHVWVVTGCGSLLLGDPA